MIDQAARGGLHKLEEQKRGRDTQPGAHRDHQRHPPADDATAEQEPASGVHVAAETRPAKLGSKQRAEGRWSCPRQTPWRAWCCLGLVPDCFQRIRTLVDGIQEGSARIFVLLQP